MLPCVPVCFDDVRLFEYFLDNIIRHEVVVYRSEFKHLVTVLSKVSQRPTERQILLTRFQFVLAVQGVPGAADCIPSVLFF